MHLYQKYPSPYSIQQFVQFFWEFEGAFNEVTAFQQRVTASVDPTLAFQFEGGMNYNQRQLFRSGFQGQCSSYGSIATNSNVKIFGVYFYPQAIPLLFQIPAYVLNNEVAEIADVIGWEGKVLEDKIMLCTSIDEKIRIMTHFIENRALQASVRTGAITSVISSILLNSGHINITALAAKYYLSQRQFERQFRHMTGFSPKKFARIVRFNKTLETIVAAKQSLTEVSYSLGYFDQSHMIKEFKEFSGQAPVDYFLTDISYYYDK